MGPEGFPPRGSPVVPGLGSPPHALSQEGGDHEEAVEDHPDGSEDHGQDDLEENAQKKTYFSPVEPGLEIGEEDGEGAEEFRQEEEQCGGAEERYGPVGAPDGQLREEFAQYGHVDRLEEDLRDGLGGVYGQEDEPEEGRAVGEDAVDEQRPVGREKPPGEEQACVLEVPLAPPAVPLEFVDEGGGRFLPASLQVVGEPDAVTGPAHESRFNVVVAEDVAAQRSFAGKAGKFAVLHERFHPDKGVVAAVLGVAELPEMEPCGQQGAVDVVGELLHPGDEGFPVHRLGGCLEDADVRPGLHDLNQPHQCLSRHDAVRIENGHVPVAFSPAPAEVGHVAALPLGVACPLPVEDTPEGAFFDAEAVPGLFLLHPDVRVGGVTQQEEVEPLQGSRLPDGVVGCPQPGDDPLHLFVVYGNEDGCPGGTVGDGKVEAVTGPGDPVGVLFRQQDDQSRDRGPEAHGNPGEEGCEHRHEEGVQQDASPVGQEPGHGVAGDDGRDEDNEEEQQAPPAPGAPPGRDRSAVSHWFSLRRAPASTAGETGRGMSSREGGPSLPPP
ncbi:hypothetical protein SDC9_44395 [bioreactor metagenome]|uniref:Uncharacterized protein n=1 Tax=bioreactor metagenome TaxID=1076179 RepID=A0A644W387_9ZZZZ